MVTIEIPLWLLWVFVSLMVTDCILSGGQIYYRRKLLKLEEKK